MKRSISSSAAGFTLVEIMVTCAILVLVGGIAYTVLNTGLILFAKNTSVNMAHQEARMAMLNMQRDLHKAISPPQLVDANGAPVSGNGPAAGISFQVFAAGPFKVAAKASAGDSQITLALGDYQPKAGQRLIIPSHSIELDIAEDSPGNSNRIVKLIGTLKNSIDVKMDLAGKMEDKNVIGFITNRVTYQVSNGAMAYYAKAGADPVFLANNVTSDAPFAKPGNTANNPKPQSLASINLTTTSLANSGRAKGKRKYRSVNMLLNAEVPPRAQLTETP